MISRIINCITTFLKDKIHVFRLAWKAAFHPFSVAGVFVLLLYLLVLVYMVVVSAIVLEGFIMTIGKLWEVLTYKL